MSVPDLSIIDGHNDVLLRLWLKEYGAAQDFVDGDGLGHMDLPRMKAGNMAGGFFAIFPRLSMPLPGDDDNLNPPYVPPCRRTGPSGDHGNVGYS